MIQSINNILNKTLNIEITRLPKYKLSNIKAVYLNMPLYIEFIGLSGVGKTTLFEKIKQRSGKDRGWFTSKEFLFQNKLTDSNSFYKEEYKALIIAKIESVMSREYRVSDELSSISHFFRKIQEEALINRFNKNYTILFDEGLYSNFRIELHSMLFSKPAYFNYLLNNRAFIECTSSPEKIAEQIQRRQKISGIIHASYKGRSLKELIEIQKKSSNERLLFLKALKDHHFPILHLNTSDNLEENIKKIDVFIENQQRAIN